MRAPAVSLRSRLRYPPRSTASSGARSTPDVSVTVSRKPGGHTKARVRPAHASVRTRDPVPQHWHCAHTPPVEPVGRAEGDEAGHSRLAATAAHRAHGLAGPRGHPRLPPRRARARRAGPPRGCAVWAATPERCPLREAAESSGGGAPSAAWRQ